MPCDGAQTNFEFSFPGGYIDASHISVTTVAPDGTVEVVAYTLSGPWTVVVAPAPAAGKILRIRRLTPTDAPLVNFAEGATVSEANLDKATLQPLLAAADAADTGTIAAQAVRADATALRLWEPAAVADWLSSSLLTILPTTFKGDTGEDSTVPGPDGPTGPAPALTIGNVTNIATGGAATAGLRANGPGAYYLDLGLPIGATGSGSSVAWGGISGSLASQTDLVAALAAKADDSDLASYATVTSVNTALAGKEPTIAAGAAGQFWRGDKTWQTLNKAAVGLGNVDNTSDANKPVSTAQQTALNGKSDTTHNHDATYQKKVTISTAAPSGGAAGDLWFKVAA